MTHPSKNLQPSLFEAERPFVKLGAAQRSELAAVVELLLREIAASLAKSAIGGAAMTKITIEHLARSACVYIRQSTADQLAHNHESRRRQYGLVDRAKQIGWSNIDVIDDDLGRSAGGIARPGFERLLATICDGRVGAGSPPGEQPIDTFSASVALLKCWAAACGRCNARARKGKVPRARR